MSDLVKSLEPSLFVLFSIKKWAQNFYTSVKCILVVHCYLPLSVEKYCLSVKINTYINFLKSDEIFLFVLTKTAYPHGQRWLEDDSALENYASYACWPDEVGDNEETIADDDLWLLRSGCHRQHEQMKGV